MIALNIYRFRRMTKLFVAIDWHFTVCWLCQCHFSSSKLFKEGFAHHFLQGPAADSLESNSHRIFSLNDITEGIIVCAKCRH